MDPQSPRILLVCTAVFVTRANLALTIINHSMDFEAAKTRVSSAQSLKLLCKFPRFAV
jgi:hypothetical protein